MKGRATEWLTQGALLTIFALNLAFFGLLLLHLSGTYLPIPATGLAAVYAFLMLLFLWTLLRMWRRSPTLSTSALLTFQDLDSSQLLPVLNLSEHAHEGLVLLLAQAEQGPYIVRYANTTFVRLLNQSAQLLYGADLDAFTFSANDHDALRRLLLAPPASPEDQTETEVAFRTSGNQAVPCHVRAAHFLSDNHTWVVLFVQATGVNPLVQERVEEYTSRLEMMVNERTEAFLQVERQTRMLMESMDDIVVSLDVAGDITYVNPAWSRHIGYPKDTTLAHSFLEHVHKEDAPRLQRLFEQAMREKVNISRVDFRFQAADGEWRAFAGNLSMIKDLSDNVIGSVLVWRDVTDQRRLEEHLRESQRLESVGLMASGIAHDFNNLFHEVIGFTRRIKRNPQSPADVGRDAESVEQVIERASNFIRQLLSFAASESTKTEAVFDLNDSLRGIHDIVSRSFPSSIKLSLDLRATLRLKGDPAQFEQVILNLLINARDAMPDGGSLAIRSYDQPRDERTPLTTPGPWLVMLEVEDSGAGIPPEIQARVFDPFFTTKGPGKGSGLGLSTVYGIIKNHSGFITLASQVGIGTRFTIGLPAMGVPAQKASAPELPALRPAAKSEDGLTVLVVDDDREIRDLTIEALQQEGFRVLSAAGGHEAIESYQAFQREVDVVVMDMMMPGMDGRETLRHLRRINPSCRAIISSGQNFGRAEELAASPLTRFLRKPYTLETLIQTLHELALHD